METVLFGAFLTQYDEIKATLKEVKPFLNINEEMVCCYRLIFVLKILFVVYAFVRASGKHLPLIFKDAEKLCCVCKNPIFTDFLPIILSNCLIFLLWKETLPLNLGEFLTDIFVLIFSLYYAVEAYKEQLEKLSSVVFMCLFVQWFLNHAASTGEFELSAYLQVLLLLLLSYCPMMPNNPQYRRILAFLYLVICLWIVYNTDQHYNKHHYAMRQSIIKGSIREERHTTVETERGNLDDSLQNFGINRESMCWNTKNIQSTVDAMKEVVPSKAQFPCNQEQSITEKLERVCKPTSFNKIIQNGGTKNTIECDISDGKVNKDGKNSDHQKLEAQDIKHDVIGATSKVVTEGKFTEAADSDIESTENGKAADGKKEAGKSNDANFEQEKKNSNGKRKIQVLKRRGEISKAAASKMKAIQFNSKVGSNDIAIKTSPHSKNTSREILGSGKHGLAGGNVTNIVHMGKVSQVKIGHNDNDETGLQVKNSRASKQGRIKPVKVRTVKSAKKLLPSKMSKPIVNKRDKSKEKDFLAISSDGPGSDSEV